MHFLVTKDAYSFDFDPTNLKSLAKCYDTRLSLILKRVEIYHEEFYSRIFLP